MNYIKFFLGIIITLVIVSCANRAAGPTGGLKDTIPPIVLRTVPLDGVVNYKKKGIQIYFNENISVEKVTENVLISPPQKTQPLVKGNSKLLTVELQDELLDSTTYTILFGNAVVDLNEKNPLKNLSFSFATGPEIDTLQISGRLINAENLDPVAGVLVGIHSNLNDSAISTLQFARIGKSDGEGMFNIRNIKAGSYKLYALKDLSRDFIYQPGEEVAFYDSIIVPDVTIKHMTDTLWKDSVTMDTIRHSIKTTYLPDNITLKLFKEAKKRQYLVKSERLVDKYFSFVFNAPIDTLPKLLPLNFDENTRFLVQENLTKDSLIYWIPDSIVYKMDTLKMAIRYLKTDSLNHLVPVTDTLNLALRKQKVTTKAKAPDTAIAVVPALVFQTNQSSNFDLYEDIHFDFEEPLDTVFLEQLHLFQKVDTVLKPVDFKWQMSDSIGRAFALKYPWKPEDSFELQIDSATFQSIYGKVNTSQKIELKIKSLDEYSALKIMLENFDSLAIIQILDANETVLRSAPANSNGTRFEYLKPGDYFVRLFIDENGNGVWDPGDIALRKQPEKVFYFKKKLTLRANWELEDSWNHLETTSSFRKPEDLSKTNKKRQK